MLFKVTLQKKQIIYRNLVIPSIIKILRKKHLASSCRCFVNKNILYHISCIIFVIYKEIWMKKVGHGQSINSVILHLKILRKLIGVSSWRCLKISVIFVNKKIILYCVSCTVKVKPV